MSKTKAAKTVKLTVSIKKAYFNGAYHSEWKVFRVRELGGGLVAKKCIADVYGPRKLALQIARALARPVALNQ